MSIFAFSACQKSNNNFLKNIEISSGELIPDFSKDVNEYAVTSLNSLKAVNINAVAEDKNSKIEYNRNLNDQKRFKLKSLSKTKAIEITVTAENGSKRIYRIKTLPDDFPPISVRETTKPSNGYIFLSNFSLNPKFISDYGRYLMIIDNEGREVASTSIIKIYCSRAGFT